MEVKWYLEEHTVCFHFAFFSLLISYLGWYDMLVIVIVEIVVVNDVGRAL